MQQICLVNGLGATFMFRLYFQPASTHSCYWQDQFYIHKAPINSALFSCTTGPPCLTCDFSPCTPQCSSHYIARLWKHDPSMKGTLHIQFRKGQPGALLHVRINGMLKASKA